jgi:shikimate dehydrogenase
MTIALDLSGATRVIPIIGDPIAQVKSPAGVTEELARRGRNAVVVPIHVTAADVDAFMRGLGLARNVDGVIATVPHKFAAYGHCATATDRAHFLRAANTLRRNRDGTWHGDALDGLAMVAAIRQAGGEPEGTRALLVGAGGAGSAIALALLDSGVAELAIHDAGTERRDDLVRRLAARFGDRVRAGSSDPSGRTLVVNATPAGMRADDPLPVDIERLAPAAFVADVITAPEVTPLVAAARRLGCATQVGTGMFAAVMVLMVDFLTEAPTGAGAGTRR